MEKKLKTWKRVCVLIVTTVSFLGFWQSAQGVQNVYASEEKQAQTETVAANNGVQTEPGEVNDRALAETEEAGNGTQAEPEGENRPEAEEAEKRLKKVIPLNEDKITQIPKYIVEEDTAYVLDETSVKVEVTETGSSEGADVVTFSRKAENLPDNDLARIEKTMLQEGIICELLSVIYEVEEEDEYGIPMRYSALCEYGGLKKYSTSYPAAWQMTVWYDACGPVDEGGTVTEYEYEYNYVQGSRRTGEGGTGTGGKAESGETEKDAAFPKPSIKKFRTGQTAGDDEEKEIADILVPLAAAAAAAGTGVSLPFMIWFTVMSVPLFALKKEEKYRYIGRIRLKKEEGIYTAYLTRRLFSKAEIPAFMIKLPEKVRKKMKTDMLQVHCPDGKRILLQAEKEVKFTVEGEII